MSAARFGMGHCFSGVVDCGKNGELLVNAVPDHGGMVYLTSGVAVINLPARAAGILAAAIRKVISAGAHARDHIVIDSKDWALDPHARMHVYRVMRNIWIGHGGMSWRIDEDEAGALAGEIEAAVAWIDRQTKAVPA